MMNWPHPDVQVCNLAENLKRVELKGPFLTRAPRKTFRVVDLFPSQRQFVSGNQTQAERVEIPQLSTICVIEVE